MRRSCRCSVLVVAAIALSAFVSVRAAGQDKSAKASEPGSTPGSNSQPLPPGGPAPRLDGHPDLSGVWFPGSTGTFDFINSPRAQRQFDPKVTPEEKPPFQPWAAAKHKELYPTEVAVELQRPSVNCMPRGVPGMFTANPYPIQLVQTPGQLVILVELNNNFRVIPVDGRAHTEDPDPTFNGESVAHWEGETLVIDTIAIDERTWNDTEGWFHSDQEHIVERLTRPSVNYLVYQVTIEDPKVLTKPWTSAPRKWSLNHGKLDEYICTNNQELQEFQQIREEEKSK
jgi:hypothetical protein